MTSEGNDSAGPPASPQVYEELAGATPEGRAEIVLRQIREHPEGRLVLPERDGVGAVLDGLDLGLARPEGGPARDASLRGADLRGAKLRQANLRGIDLGKANLEGASLGGADLRRALLEEANLRGADLASSRLRGAALGNADLREALLEEASLARASLRFADLREAALENADLRHADLWGGNLAGASANGADLRGADLKESNLQGADFSAANLRGAALGRADLRGAKLRGADLRGAAITGANFRGADLRGARLQGLDLGGCDIAHVLLNGAWLEKTRFALPQFAGAIGEELAGHFDEARKAYLALERSFTDLGDPDAASWAYLRKRRMQKREAARRAAETWRARNWRGAASAAFDYASDQLVEWMCDYGESIARVLGSMVVVFLIFALLYGLTGSVVRIREGSAGAVRMTTRTPSDLALFSLMAMISSGNLPAGLEPRNEAVHLLTGLQALLGIALTGLLGFVTGNLVRR